LVTLIESFSSDVPGIGEGFAARSVLLLGDLITSSFYNRAVVLYREVWWKAGREESGINHTCPIFTVSAAVGCFLSALAVLSEGYP
jgi:hypothetical protein